MLRHKKTIRQSAEEWGIDLSLLEANLERTPTKRLILHQRSLNTAELLQEAYRHERSQRNPQTTRSKRG